mmetsp:Transcript_8611/g.16917  ORF Transcript_8611/g.16917 Transcript_8611/m.16917 type:complete len:164 (+) Transcript_8611:296-787(+)
MSRAWPRTLSRIRVDALSVLSIRNHPWAWRVRGINRKHQSKMVRDTIILLTQPLGRSMMRVGLWRIRLTNVNTGTKNSKPFTCDECSTMAATGSREYTWEHVSRHCRPESCWIVAHNIVYDATSFLKVHPAGSKSVLRRGGRMPRRIMIFIPCRRIVTGRSIG